MKDRIRLFWIASTILLLTLLYLVLTNDCYAQKKIPHLSGRVQIVTSHADYKVRLVDTHADLEVKVVGYDSKIHGEWYFVNNHPNFTIQYVGSHKDLKIKFKE